MATLSPFSASPEVTAEQPPPPHTWLLPAPGDTAGLSKDSFWEGAEAGLAQAVQGLGPFVSTGELGIGGIHLQNNPSALDKSGTYAVPGTRQGTGDITGSRTDVVPVLTVSGDTWCDKSLDAVTATCLPGAPPPPSSGLNTRHWRHQPARGNAVVTGQGEPKRSGHTQALGFAVI